MGRLPSVPGLRGKVPRPSKSAIPASTHTEKSSTAQWTAFTRAWCKHEVDHLDGILYPMRMTDLSQLGFTEILFPDLAGVDDD